MANTLHEHSVWNPPPLSPDMESYIRDRINRAVAQSSSHNPDDPSPAVPAHELEHIASQIEFLEMGVDMTVADQGKDNTAHVLWRDVRRWAGSTPAPNMFEMRFSAVLADDAPSLRGQLVLVLVGFIAIVFATNVALLGYDIGGPPHEARELLRAVVPYFGWIDPLGVLAKIPWPKGDFGGRALGNADALVAVLLIGPVFMLSRLDMPRGDSVLAFLRRSGQVIAYLGVIAISYLSIAVATTGAPAVPDGTSLGSVVEGSEPPNPAASLADEYSLVTYFLIGLLGYAILQFVTGLALERCSRLRKIGGPMWLFRRYGLLSRWRRLGKLRRLVQWIDSFQLRLVWSANSRFESLELSPKGLELRRRKKGNGGTY